MKITIVTRISLCLEWIRNRQLNSGKGGSKICSPSYTFLKTVFIHYITNLAQPTCKYIQGLLKKKIPGFYFLKLQNENYFKLSPWKNYPPDAIAMAPAIWPFFESPKLELFRSYCLKIRCRIRLNFLYILESLSFERRF